MHNFNRLKYRTEQGLSAFVMSRIKSGRTIKKCLEKYPTYDLPYVSRNSSLSRKEAAANYAFFKQEKNYRLKIILELLNRFGVSIDVTKPSKRAILSLDEWAYQQWPDIYFHSLYLTNTAGFSLSGFEMRVRSLLFDVAVLLGECYLAVNEKAEWYCDISEESKVSELSTVNRITIKLPLDKYHSSTAINLLDLEENVFYHYGSQKKSNAIILVDQRIGRVLGEAIIAQL